MYPCNCNSSPQWVSTPCTSCPSTFSCDPCTIIGSVTPMTQCEVVDLCGEGCLETIRDTCVVHRGALLPTIEAIEGDSLASMLLKINNILRILANSEPLVPTYNYRLVCLTNPLDGVTLNSVLKNGAPMLGSPQVFTTAANALAFLLTLDPAWSFTSPNLFHINSPDTWLITGACP